MEKLPSAPRVGIVAPSSVVPPVEFGLGLERLRAAGLAVRVHPQVRRQHLFYAGPAADRARALFDYARDPRLDALWCARGGSGASRLLPMLERLTRARGAPAPKLLVGYSDATALLEFARARWGWSVLHAPMPGLRKFCRIPEREFGALLGCLRGEARAAREGALGKRLRFATPPPPDDVRGKLVGGNLTVWTHLLGTPYLPRLAGKILFLEDVEESLYRIDRMLDQLLLSGSLRGVRAIVLGTFTNCRDAVGQALRVTPTTRNRDRLIDDPRPAELGPVRPRLDEAKWIPRLFARAGAELGIPVAYGLPCGHGTGYAPLPLGAEYTLAADGRLTLRRWDWTDGRGRALPQS